MRELECKILDVKKEASVNWLKRYYHNCGMLPPEKVFHGIMRVKLLGEPDTGQFVRIRELKDQRHNTCQVEVAVKKDIPRSLKPVLPEGVKLLNEYSCKVEKITEAIDLFEALGFTPIEEFWKERESWVRDDVRYEYDRFLNFEDSRTWLEIEAEDMESLEFGVKAVGYTMNDISAVTTRQLYEEVCRGIAKDQAPE